ncbi:MAG: hypothetical protein GXO97_10265, partial [Nitrospirae bacterium]|nr:hypothetical protein [Nitrospirota bacterium]
NDMAANILSRMNPRKAARIFAQMSPRKAALLTEQIAKSKDVDSIKASIRK